ncbi:hypothetical protein S225a_20060 [Candidatus Brocadiaceae bacterium S225]|nr:hypothetical protein S225a_20060 [Candidatus Brocadiaceae bacterium S225]
MEATLGSLSRGDRGLLMGDKEGLLKVFSESLGMSI